MHPTHLRAPDAMNPAAIAYARHALARALEQGLLTRAQAMYYQSQADPAAAWRAASQFIYGHPAPVAPPTAMAPSPAPPSPLVMPTQIAPRPIPMPQLPPVPQHVSVPVTQLIAALAQMRPLAGGGRPV